MRKILLLLLVSITIACKDEAPEVNFTINGDIEGLKTGKVLLQKVKDSSLITLDSVVIDGNSKFNLSGIIAQPQLLYVHLDVNDGTKYDDRISVFVEEGEMSLNAELNDFENSARVSGSKNDSVFSLFKKNKKRLDAAYADLVKRSLTISQSEEDVDPMELQQLDEDYQAHLKRRVLFALNYARINKELEVAPYILLSEAFDANPKLLDSTFQMMPKKIQNSLYGKELSGLIELSKKENGL
jgi:hypothetical protein